MDDGALRARCVNVALPVPLHHTFTYRVPEGMAWPVPVGSRVKVPFGSRTLIGICTGIGIPPDGVSLKNVAAVLDDEPSLTAPLLETAKWISRWYAAPIGVTLRSMLPASLTQNKSHTAQGKVEKFVRIAKEMPSLLMRERQFARSPKQRKVYELLEVLGGEASMQTLLVQAQCTPAVISTMVKHGIVEVTESALQRDPFQHRAGTAPPPQPSSDQRAVIDRILSAKAGEAFLLHGVTGSGKTLVYIEVLRAILSEPGRTAIVLVPEIALTPQTVDRFRGAFGDDVAVLHSGLSDGERYDAWQSLRKGERRIAVGARSALFAPLERVGAVIVDEEHEASYKQAEAPRYHAREAAIVRARAEGAITILGSATPSLESWDRAGRKRVTLLTLPVRAAGASLPMVSAVDMREIAERERQEWVPGKRRPSESGILSPKLLDAIEDRCSKGEQTLLLLNRRGYSSFLQCDECGAVPKCPHCSISLTYHRSSGAFVCHYCNFQKQASSRCDECGQPTLKRHGAGTQQVERLIVERFPNARVARMDMDTTSGKWAHARILDRVAQGEVDILLGTQMIAKGLDFPNVTLVGVVDADVGLNIPDFRASERTFQLLSQVAGRAGRGPKGGEVIVQTRLPDADAIRFALTHDYLGFVNKELTSREVPAYPPLVSLANVVVSGQSKEAVEAAAHAAVLWLNQALKHNRTLGVEVVGPSPCPVEKVKDRWRWHFFVRSRDARLLSRVVGFIAVKCPVGRGGGRGSVAAAGGVGSGSGEGRAGGMAQGGDESRVGGTAQGGGGRGDGHGSIRLVVDRDPVSML